MSTQTTDPVRLPDPVPETAAPGEVIEINRSAVYYVVTAALFFVFGYIVAWLVFNSTMGSVVNDIKSAVSDTMSTKIAQMPANAVAVNPTETPIPHQTIDPGDSPSWGPADAKVTVVEYSDFQCPYCELFYRSTYKLMQQKYGDKIRFVYKDFPLPQHPDAMPAAVASHCAIEQGKFWEYHDALFSNQQDLSKDALIRYAGQIGLDVPKFTDCFQTGKYQAKVNQNLQSGINYSANSTPTFFINGDHFAGAYSFDQMSQILDYYLSRS